MSYCEILHMKEIKKSRKSHRCLWCGQEIPIGSTYWEFANKYDGDFNCDAFHPECWDACDRNAYERDDGTYEPYRNHRGMTENEWEDQKDELSHDR
jgi:hypothetical protein